MKARISGLPVKHKVLIWLTTSIVGVGAVALWLNFPLLFNAGQSNGYNCSRAHIYLPARLDSKGCKTVTGTVKRVKVEKDGDIHVRFILDKQYAHMLTPQNYKLQEGTLVVEDSCRSKPRELVEIFARFACYGYTSSLPTPTIGKRYEITGNYVIDDWHGSWAEFHGLTELKPLN
jgi:hypothetical protein